MALDTPNYFDEYKRIRTHSLPYDPNKDYRLIISQLKEACGEFNYLGTSPQNLVEPAELLPVIIIRQVEQLRVFLEPQIIDVKGGRLQYDGCGNIYLMHDGKKVHLVVLIRRPRYLRLAYVTEDGRREKEWFFDPVRRSTSQSMVGAICHESAHLRGELILDNARQRLVNLFRVMAELIKKRPEAQEELTLYAYRKMPYGLIRKGDMYVLRHGSEFAQHVPDVTPDALFFDGVMPFDKILEMRVPRGGELLPIRYSKLLKSVFS